MGSATIIEKTKETSETEREYIENRLYEIFYKYFLKSE